MFLFFQILLNDLRPVGVAVCEAFADALTESMEEARAVISTDTRRVRSAAANESRAVADLILTSESTATSRLVPGPLRFPPSESRREM